MFPAARSWRSEPVPVLPGARMRWFCSADSATLAPTLQEMSI
jgi:hypothetical protein